jgi:hypothetical protein
MQQFFKGDLVKVGEMPKYMSHFIGNCEAIVLGTYSEICGRGTPRHDKEYQLFILKRGERGESAWYEESQLSLLQINRLDLLPKTSIHRMVAEAKAARDDNK